MFEPNTTTTTIKEENDEECILKIQRRDFDCPLCFQLLYEPITLSCGHTMCRDCTYQAFQFKKHCPICRHHSSIDIITAPANVLISKLLEKYNNIGYKLRGSEMNKIKSLRKSRHPIFISRTPEYPYCCISLHIYEAKYRVMVNRILNSDSKFIIAYMNHNISSNNYPHSIGTLCQIKNCTSFLDGRSHIKVIGLKRVKLTNIKLETDSFGLLSAEIDDYLDIDDEKKEREISLTSTLINDNNGNNDNNKFDNNKFDNNKFDNNKFDSFLNYLDKLRTNMNENLNFQTRKWLTNDNNNNNNNNNNDNNYTEERKETEALKESDMMDKLLLLVSRFIEQEESNKDIFYKRVGYPPKNISSFSLWIAGALPRKLSQSGGYNSSNTNIEIQQLQLQILVSRNVKERLELAHNLAILCIQCSQKRSKVQFWIIVCIIGLAILYELLNGS